MRFLKVGQHGELSMTEDFTQPPDAYAILSHRWGSDNDEVTFDTWEKSSSRGKPGYAKLVFCANQARRDGLTYFWVDTCCINRNNLVELDESIRSMFRWYQNAEKCYVYLPDVVLGHVGSNAISPSWKAAFRRSTWFKRGWTLQELLAPKVVEFFSKDCQPIGTKITLEREIHEITGIPVEALRGEALSKFSVEERLRWAEQRETKKIEDKAYCLFGIFNVFLSLRYGERDNAFARLKAKIGITPDQVDAEIRRVYGEGRLVVERLSGKSLSLEDCFINLCIVDHNRDINARPTGDALDIHSDSEQLLSKFSLAARLKVETPSKLKQVSLRNLFDLRNRKDGSQSRPSRILIWGSAGMGKTTLCKKMVYDFYHHNLWRDLYNHVIWLPLRRLKHMEHEVHSVVRLIQQEFFADRSEKNLEERLQNIVLHHERTLFILDGLDEISYSLDLETPIGRVLNILLTRSNTIITSRPHSTSILDHIPLDLELETIGFLPQQVEEYIRRSAKQTNTSDITTLEIQSFIEKRPLVQSLARIPVQLDAICYCWNTESFPKDNVTMTTLYHAISQKLLQKDIVRLGKTSDGRPMTKQRAEVSLNIEAFMQPETKFLENLAFQGLHEEVIEFKVAHVMRLRSSQPLEGDLPVHMSFLRSSDNSLEAARRTLHFIHLTFQEFFAARYFVRHWTSRTALTLQRCLSGKLSAKPIELMPPEKFLQVHKYVGRYDIFWRFVTGLLQMEADHSHLDRFFIALDEEPLDLIGLTHQRLTIHCLSEVDPANIKFQPEIRRREEIYVQWALCESRFRSSQKSLIWEAECSDYIIETLLKEHETQNVVMRTLCQRPSVSSIILDMVLSISRESIDKYKRQIAIQVLGRQCSTTREKKFVDFWHSVQYLSEIRQEEIAEALEYSTGLQQPAVNALVALLQHPKHNVRYNAAQALQSQTSLPSSAIEILVALLQHPEYKVQSNAAQVLHRQTSLPSSAIETLVALLQHPEDKVQDNASLPLCNQTSLPSSAIETLVALLQHPEDKVQDNAAQVLHHQTNLPSSAIETLVALLQHPEDKVQCKAAHALYRQANLPSSAIETLVALLQHPKTYVGFNAAGALQNQISLPSSAIETLIALLRHPTTSIQSNAVEALQNQTSLPSSAIETLVTLLQHPEDSMWYDAAQALQNQRRLPSSAIETLVTFLQHPEDKVQSIAAQVLQSQTSLTSSTIETLVALLQHPEDSICYNAAQALQNQRRLPSSAIETLVALLQRPETFRKCYAAQVLRNQTSLPSSAIETLAALLRHPTTSIQFNAAQALQNQTSLPSSAIETLVTLLLHPNTYVRFDAVQALQNQTSLPSSAIETLLAFLQYLDPIMWYKAAAAIKCEENLPWSILSLDSLAIQRLLQVWLCMGSVACFIWNDKLCLDINGKRHEAALQYKQQVLLETAFGKAREALGFPATASVSMTGDRRKRKYRANRLMKVISRIV